jgi:hypothetical protein
MYTFAQLHKDNYTVFFMHSKSFLAKDICVLKHHIESLLACARDTLNR